MNKRESMKRWNSGEPLPDPGPHRERVISALEALVREYRSGRGDVAHRMTPWLDSDGAPRSFVDALTILLLGEKGLPEGRVGGGPVWVKSRREFSALAEIGGGSAEAGVGVVVNVSLAWMQRDPAGMAEWLRGALPRLKRQGFIPDAAQKGVLGVALWTLPSGHPTWWSDLEEGLLTPAGLTGQQFGPEEVVRAMALAWNSRSFPARHAALWRAA